MSVAAAAIGAGASLAGGLINSSNVKAANAANERMAWQNIKMQQDFAQHGIKWKVDDARDAGIHPLYALGAQTTSFSPVSVGHVADTSMGSALASAGQDISRAMNATRTAPERLAAFEKTVNDLNITNMGLKNELLATQIAKLKSSINPPMPDIGPIPEGKSEDRPPLLFGGHKIHTEPNTSNAEDYEKRYGDDVGGWLSGLGVMYRDLQHNLRDVKFKDLLWKLDRATRIW